MIQLDTGIVSFLSFFELALGISEAYYGAFYSQYEDQCHQIWGWIVASCVLNIVIPIITCCGLTVLFNNNSNNHHNHNNKKKLYILQYAHLGQFIIGIWSVATYYNINDSCYNFWTTNAPELWTFVMVHFVMLWICLVLACISIICNWRNLKKNNGDAVDNSIQNRKQEFQSAIEIQNRQQEFQSAIDAASTETVTSKPKKYRLNETVTSV